LYFDVYFAQQSPNATLTPVFLQIMKQIGYPESPSWIKQFELSSIVGSTPTISRNDAIWRIRGNHAIGLLFQVASEIGADAVDNDHRPLIMIDEVFDAVRKDKYADIGGEEIMDRICGMTVQHNIDEKIVNVFMAGSSCLLLQALSARRLHAVNISVVPVEDPSEKDVKQYLSSIGYSPELCKTIVESLGCRLRILNALLSSKLSDNDVNKHIFDCHLGAIRDILIMFEACSDKTSRDVIHRILDDLILKPNPRKVAYSELPQEIQNHLSIKVFYVDRALKLSIQRVPIRNAWLEIRTENKLRKK
jgi:hypothetical protein